MNETLHFIPSYHQGAISPSAPAWWEEGEKGMKEMGIGDFMLNESPIWGPDCRQCKKRKEQKQQKKASLV